MSCDQNDHAIGDILTEISSMTINENKRSVWFIIYWFI